MSFVKTILQKTGRLLLSIVRILRRALCCRRRRRESGMLLPLTVNYSTPPKEEKFYDDNKRQIVEAPDFHDWNSWEENERNNLSAPCATATSEIEYRVANDGEILNRQNSTSSNPEDEDFFKDMVPQFRKPKKFIVKEIQEETELSNNSRLLAMDPRAFPAPGRELGVIDDNPSDWRDVETLDDSWDADTLLKEKKIADRERRIAEHQRRKLEKENKRAYKETPVKANSFYASDTRYS